MGVWSANSNPEQDPDASPEQLMRLYRQLSHFHQPVVSRRSTTVECVAAPYENKKNKNNSRS